MEPLRRCDAGAAAFLLRELFEEASDPPIKVGIPNVFHTGEAVDAFMQWCTHPWRLWTGRILPTGTNIIRPELWYAPSWHVVVTYGSYRKSWWLWGVMDPERLLATAAKDWRFPAEFAASLEKIQDLSQQNRIPHSKSSEELALDLARIMIHAVSAIRDMPSVVHVVLRPYAVPLWIGEIVFPRSVKRCSYLVHGTQGAVACRLPVAWDLVLPTALVGGGLVSLMF